jgi:DNA-binding transcriptional ArsR family regulator
MAERRPDRSAERRADKAPAAGANRMRVVPGLSLSSSADSFEKLIHERLRLAIVSALAVHDTLTFNALKEMIGTTDGNLSVHARKLEEAGYVACTKGFDGRTPRTEFKLTAAGKRSLERYLAHMESLIKAVREK